MKEGPFPRKAPSVPTPRSGHSRHTLKTGTLLDRVMVPVDFSTPSLNALNYALFLAKASHAAVNLIHVVEPAPFMSGLESLPIVLSDTEAATECGHELARLATRHSSPDVPISSAVRIGKPAYEVCKAAHETETDLIVTSTHGRTGLTHLLLGSVAEKILREAACPVLMIRTRESEAELATTVETPPPPVIQKILVPTDFSTASIEALQYSVRFAEMVGAEITLLHCVLPTMAFSAAQSMAMDMGAVNDSLRYAAKQTITNIAREHLHREVDGGADVVMGPPLAEIPEFARLGRFDLIICATHGYSGLKRILLGSTAEGLVRYSPCPVLAVRGHPERKRPATEVSLHQHAS